MPLVPTILTMSPLFATITSASCASPFGFTAAQAPLPAAYPASNGAVPQSFNWMSLPPEPPKIRFGAVGALGRRRQAEEVRAAADDVVLALVAEDDVAAAAALDVVAAVEAGLVVGRRVDLERVARVSARPDELRERPAGRSDGAAVEARERRRSRVRERRRNRAVALDDVVAELPEDHVVGRAARDVVVAVRRGQRRRGLQRRRLVEVADPGEELVLGPVRAPATGCCRGSSARPRC